MFLMKRNLEKAIKLVERENLKKMNNNCKNKGRK